jgi:DNA-binding protein WhiA
VRSAGTLHLRGSGRIAVHLETASAAVARRAFSLVRAYGVPCEIRTFRRRAFDRSTRFQLHLGEDPRALQVLHEAGVLNAKLVPLDHLPRRVVARSCCRSSYLRGALLASGSVSGPRNAHLELRAASVEGAEFLAGLARTEGILLAVRDRGRHAVAYAKGIETIADALAFVGAHETALRLGESSVVSATRGRANRLANADHANLKRTSTAAAGQLRAIARLEAKGRLAELAPELREIADLRRRHPTLSLTDLASRCRPPATRSAAQRRLAKLRKLAQP